MNDTELLDRIFPDSLQPIHVVSPTGHGLLLDNGCAMHWPDEETGVVLLFDFEGEIVGEFSPCDDNYDNVLELFKSHPSPHDIVQRPRLRVVRFEDEEQ